MLIRIILHQLFLLKIKLIILDFEKKLISNKIILNNNLMKIFKLMMMNKILTNSKN